MNTRDRFHAAMSFEPLDRPLYWEFGYWTPTIRRWYREGLPEVVGIPDDLGDDTGIMGELGGIDWRNPIYDRDVHDTMGLDEFLYRIPINNLFCPAFEPRILEDHEAWYTMTDADGVTLRVWKSNGSRHFLDAPVHSRGDYERIREERLQPNLSERLPSDWTFVREKLEQRTYPLMYGGMQGFFNTPRRFLGFERLMYAFYDDPQLIKDMINHAADLLIALYDPVLSDIGGDLGMISEDMSYKSGCFVSPAMFREFMLPAYRKLTGFYRDHGIHTILVDSDGDVMDLIPLLIEGGVTGLYPFEVTGRCDIVEARKAFPHFQILGGIDKKAIAAGRAAIDAELERKIPAVSLAGGFVPFTDHFVSPDISWEHFCYYRRRLAELA
jgi:hypothetical protein